MTSAGELRVLVVDDEAPARTLLREYLERVPGVRVAAECANGFEALKAAEGGVDVAFLDIEMPKLNGFEVRELLDPSVLPVFVTAYDAWAVKAFEVNAVDYVMKPYAPERIAAAVERARERLRARDLPSPESLAAAAAGARPEGRPLERVAVRDGAKVHVIPAARLSSARAQDDYVEIRSEGRAGRQRVGRERIRARRRLLRARHIRRPGSREHAEADRQRARERGRPTREARSHAVAPDPRASARR